MAPHLKPYSTHMLLHGQRYSGKQVRLNIPKYFLQIISPDPYRWEGLRHHFSGLSLPTLCSSWLCLFCIGWMQLHGQRWIGKQVRRRKLNQMLSIRGVGECDVQTITASCHSEYSTCGQNQWPKPGYVLNCKWSLKVLITCDDILPSSWLTRWSASPWHCSTGTDLFDFTTYSQTNERLK